MPLLSAPPAGSELLPVAEVMDRLGVCRRTVYRWVKKGLVDYVRAPGGTLRIIEPSLWRVRARVAAAERVAAPEEVYT